jgi:hypothetical protein
LLHPVAADEEPREPGADLVRGGPGCRRADVVEDAAPVVQDVEALGQVGDRDRE